MNLIQPVGVAAFLIFSGVLLHEPAAAWAAAQPVPEGKLTGSSFCSAHGKYSGTSCPTCANGGNRSSGNPGLSNAERARLEREAAEAAERARQEREKQRVAGEKKDLDAALKNSVDRAKKVTAEFDRQDLERSEKHQGEVQGNNLINDLLKEFNADKSKESLFSQGSKESAPVDTSRKGPSALASDTPPLEFMGIPGVPPPTKKTAPEVIPPSRHYDQDHPLTLSLQAEQKLVVLAEKYHQVTQKNLFVTSGTRTPATQADAMFSNLKTKNADLKDYINQGAAQEIRNVYVDGIAAQKAEETIKREMSEVIEGQIKRGVYISNHLKADAVDIRTRNMSDEERKALLKAIEGMTGIRPHLEDDHLHLELGPVSR